jgi:Mg2+/Co2+ transporter CorC
VRYGRDSSARAFAHTAQWLPGSTTLPAPVHLVSPAAYRFEIDLPHKRFRSIGGLVMDELGRIPQVGDEVRIGEVTLRVDAMSGLTITQVSIYFPA